MSWTLRYSFCVSCSWYFPSFFISSYSIHVERLFGNLLSSFLGALLYFIKEGLYCKIWVKIKLFHCQSFIFIFYWIDTEFLMFPQFVILWGWRVWQIGFVPHDMTSFRSFFPFPSFDELLPSRYDKFGVIQDNVQATLNSFI